MADQLNDLAHLKELEIDSMSISELRSFASLMKSIVLRARDAVEQANTLMDQQEQEISRLKRMVAAYKAKMESASHPVQ